ncbi:hypothetical protein L1047_02070 [Synechococcus sp. Nb3U1]|uniref:hypothetical protein n=1 Tax=Synechococcus sp. Nb3U1 TaxID=1914529 RepID=UPI001F426D38|nr:hypothetical protein [Synechococcus sp. Nb3U1]MCF2969981.1 hypothetical protein [Synechococcus sp. Nb3U1]
MTDTRPCAPCIVDAGTLVSKRDIYRLLADLGRVRYFDIIDGCVRKQGEGYVMEVFQDPTAATLVVNRSLYLNIDSFDYLCLRDPSPSEAAGSGTDQPGVVIDLVQDSRILRLVPLSDPLSDPVQLLEDTQALRAAAVDVLAAGWDAEEEDSSSDSLG